MIENNQKFSTKKIKINTKRINRNFNSNKNTEKKDKLYVKDLKSKKQEDLFNIAEKLKISGLLSNNKRSLIFEIMNNLLPSRQIIVNGILDLLNDGYGFLRYPESNYYPGPDDIYVSPSQIRRACLRKGDEITGTIKGSKENEKYLSLAKIMSVNFQKIEDRKRIINFDNLVPLYPQEWISMENEDLTGRVIDIVAPIGKGQRSLIVSPPRAGKTMILKSIAHSIEKKYPKIHLIVLLIDERPEEVTDMARFVKGEVISSTFDESPVRHIQVAEIVLERAKRLVENGKDVVILLDSITRLGRAYNSVTPSSGKILTGGVDANALQRPKRFLGAARNLENGGSLSVIATALIETGSKMDEVIFEEFKGTGNSEIVIDRKISNRRIFPAIDIMKSGTRRDDLLIDKKILTKTWIIRKLIANMGTIESAEFLIEKVSKTKNNQEFFASMNK